MNDNDKTIQSIVLIDEDDAEVEFDIMDKFDYKGDCYYVLFPLDDDSDNPEYVILRESKDGDGDDGIALVGLDDANLLDEVFEIYKSRNSLA